MKLFQLFRVEGVANEITYDDGLTSTEAEKKRLISIHAQVESYSRTDDNDIQGWLERAKVFDLPDTLLPTQKGSDAEETEDTPRSREIPVEVDIPAGQTFKIAIKCAATAKTIRGVYEYEIIT